MAFLDHFRSSNLTTGEVLRVVHDMVSLHPDLKGAAGGPVSFAPRWYNMVYDGNIL